MRRIILLLCVGVCAPWVFANNEAVYTISYNPSRLGVYEKLKAVDSANLQGGVAIGEGGILNIQSAAGQTITLEDAQPGHRFNGGKLRETANKRILSYIANVEPEGATDDFTTSLKGSAIIQEIKTTENSFWPRNAAGEYEYRISAEQPTTIDVNGTNVTIYGGSFTANEDSFINNFALGGDTTNLVAQLTARVNNLLHIEKGFHALETYTLGNITISGNTSCLGPGGKCLKYWWSPRKNAAGTEYEVLSVQVKPK